MHPAEGQVVKGSDRFAIFWGGGLGDILALRPLLLALEGTLETPPFFFTTATHMQGLFGELGLRTRPRVLPPEPFPALRMLRASGPRFDWLYLGAYPRMKTRMLAHVVQPHRIWNVRHGDRHPFVGEQVLADVEAFRLQGPQAIHLPYGGKWHPPTAGAVKLPVRPYMVLHPGAKERWETTRWPAECWAELMRRLLQDTAFELVLVGVQAERPQLEALRETLGAAADGRVHARVDLSLAEVAAALERSVGLVCHNSGILHLSAMLGKPTVAVTGSSAIFWRPPYPNVLNVTSGACDIACNQYRCPVPFFRAKCIKRLQTADVMGAVKRMLLAGAPA